MKRKESFEEGDRVVHRGENVRGTVTDTENYGAKMKIKWDDGFQTLETFHTVDFADKKKRGKK